VNNGVDRIEDIFWEAAQLAPGEPRAAYLARTCGEDRALRQRIERLLNVQPKVEGFLEQPFPSPGQLPPGEEPAAERPGTATGPYKLLEQIGEGGMGLVFLAEQSQPVRRRVALKVVKPGMDTRQVVARFEAERQALALMDHPNIAQVFDAGSTASGRPYFVMELVRGVPIIEFCDQRRLGPRQRLELFVTVCQAMQHAHQKGVIHRDLKPSNVLVTLHDTGAVLKIIDFGIAKALHQPLTDRTLVTQLTQLLGTPLYMSPEQAEMNGLDVDTRSDVCSLGVLLYELLTGTTPFQSETLKQVGLDEMRRMIREEDPPRPSQRLHTLDAQVCSTVSERRGVDGRRLGQLLRGELDWIVMRALEKDRNRRYESASAFAADVERYLKDETVAACPPSAGYRLRKYVRRNRRALVTVGIIMLALMVATAVSVWQAGLALEAQRQAETDRDRAEATQRKSEAAETRAATEAAIARAVNDFVQKDLLGQVDSDPQLSGNPNLTVKEALDRAAAKIGERFQDQPLVEAAIRTVIGDAYHSLYQDQPAVSNFERALTLRQAHLGLDHPDTLGSMRNLATAYPWVRRHADALALSERIVENRKRILGPDHAETLACERALAGTYLMGGQWDTSVRLFEELLEKRRTLWGPTHPDTLGTMHDLARNYELVGRRAESLALHEKALDGLKARNGPEHESTIWPRMTLAQVCQRAGELDRAERLLHEALAVLQKGKPSFGQRTSRSNALGWLAFNMYWKQRDAEAESLLQETLAFHEKGHPDSPRTFYWKSLLGVICLGQQRYAEAEPLLLEGYEGQKRREATHHFERNELTEADERVVRFYEVTKQPEKARVWREKLRKDKSKK
jgi:serine/threonine protein kinase/tetratricopeptide (TPR) repeat protein